MSSLTLEEIKRDACTAERKYKASCGYQKPFQKSPILIGKHVEKRIEQKNPTTLKS